MLASEAFLARNPRANELSFKVNVPAASDEALLDMVERYTVRYFTDFAEPFTGMARERSNDRNADIVTVGGSGFGLMALIAGIERGYVPREKAFSQIDRVLSFLETTERFHGMWAHWYDADTRKAFSFSQFDDGGDLVESAMKRAANTKDSGNYIPGRGGIMDNIDSLIFSAPIYYYLIIYLCLT